MNSDTKFFFENWLISSRLALNALKEILDMAAIPLLNIPEIKKKGGRTVIRWPDIIEYSSYLDIPRMTIDYFRGSMERNEYVMPKTFIKDSNRDMGRNFLASLHCNDINAYLGKIYQHLKTEHSSGTCKKDQCFLLRSVPREWIQGITEMIEELFVEAIEARVSVKYQEIDKEVKMKSINNVERLKKANKPRKERKRERESILERELQCISKDPLWAELSAYKRARVLHGIVAGNPGMKGGFETIKKWVLKYDKSGKS